MFQNLFDIVDATLLLALVTALVTIILSLVTLYNTRKFQEDQKIKRELDWIEKGLENFYSPLIFLLAERQRLINKFEKTEKTLEKDEIIQLMKKNYNNILQIYEKYIYVGLSWENYSTKSDISEFFDSNLIDKDEIDKFRNILTNKLHELGKEHDILLGNIKFRGISNHKELEKIFKEEN